VTADALLALHNPNLRSGENWRELAERPVCNECHSRLDYGMRFFNGYSSHYQSYDFVASDQVSEEGKVCIHGPDDLRGTPTTTPLAFATLATQQPEFGRCMAQAVLRNVLGDLATDADVAAVRSAYASTGTYGSMLAAALRARIAHGFDGSRDALPPVLADPMQADSLNPDGPVTIGPGLRKLIDDHCSECHDAPPRDFGVRLVPRATASKMLRAVSSHDMPRGRAMPSADRRAFLAELIAASFPPGDDRTAAWSYYARGMRALPVYRRATLGHVVGGLSFLSKPAIDSTDSVAQYTPGVALGTTLEALGTCKFANPDAGESQRASCVEQLTRPAWVIAATHAN
jgi:hypothetical protein